MNSKYTHKITSAVLSLSLVFIVSIIPLASSLIAEASHGTVKISSKFGQIGNPDVAMNDEGKSVVMWQDKGGQTYEIYGQAFDSAGIPKGVPFRVNHFRPNDQKNPQVAMNSKGDYTAVWQSYKQDGSGTGIFGRQFIWGSKTKYKEFRVNTYIRNDQANPDIAMNDNGKFVVVWVSEKDNGTKTKKIFAQRFTPEGDPEGDEMEISTEDNVKLMENPAVAMDQNGGFAVVWQAKTDNGYDIFAQIYDWDGNPVSDEDILVNTTTAQDQITPSVVYTSSNQYMIVWGNTTMHDVLEVPQENIVGQILSSNGQKFGSEIEITEPIFGHHEEPSVMQVSSSELYVAWESYKKLSQKYWAVYGKYMSLTGTPEEEERLNPTSNKWNQMPAVASDGDENINIVWVGLNGVQYKKAVYIERIMDDSAGMFSF